MIKINYINHVQRLWPEIPEYQASTTAIHHYRYLLPLSEQEELKFHEAESNTPAGQDF